MSLDEDKHKPGYASLAFEVLNEAKRSGAHMEQLQNNLWAQYLLWHARNMRAGIKVAGIIEGGIDGVQQDTD